MKNTSEVCTGCLVAIGLLALAPLFMALRGWVLSIMWGWFIVTTFNAPPIGVWAAIGIAFCVGMFVPNRAKTDEDQEWYTSVIAEVLGTLIALGIGWLIYHFGMGM